LIFGRRRNGIRGNSLFLQEPERMTTRVSSRWPAAVAVGLSLATLIVVGCTGKTPPTVVVVAKSPNSDTGAPSLDKPPAKPIENWPDDLGGVLLISGEMIGYTEPCGCTGGQKGGLIRRMILSNLLRTERKWPVAMIDLGGLINDPLKHGGPEQTKLKFETTLKALALLKYSAVALSADDLRLGTAETLMAILNKLPDEDAAPKFVTANATPSKVLELKGRFRTSMRIPIGKYQVGVTSVIDPAAFAALKDESKDSLLTVVPPSEVLAPILADLEKDTDLQVLMVQGPPKLAEELGLAYPGFDVIVATTPDGEPDTKPKTLNGGLTWLVQVGHKGQYLGAIGLPKNKKSPRLYQRLVMNDRYDSSKSRGEAMRKLIDEDYVGELKAADVLASYTKQSYLFPGKEPSKATYVGAEACKNCHPNTYNKWASTKHAQAYDALWTNPKRNREADADCVSCHTTGFAYEGGFAGVEKTPNLKGNQCENCHGPGSAHAAAPDDMGLRQSVARSSADFKKEIRCIKCHDEDNAPHGFDFDSMWAKIMHNKLDAK
jgi:hypothetical protein